MNNATGMGLSRHGDHWVWSGGPVPPGADAITIGSVVSVRRRAGESEMLLRHELVHVRQWRELGAARFLWRYLGAYARGRAAGLGHQRAYEAIPLEAEARALAGR